MNGVGCFDVSLVFLQEHIAWSYNVLLMDVSYPILSYLIVKNPRLTPPQFTIQARSRGR